MGSRNAPQFLKWGKIMKRSIQELGSYYFKIPAIQDRDPNGSFVIYGTGDRVQVHPACDCWMMGDRYGTIEKITKRSFHVRMDRSGKIRKFIPDLLMKA